MIVSVHREIVRAALGGVLTPSALRGVATANARCDLYQWQPERHFDNGRDVAALGALWRRGLHGYLVRCAACCAPADTARHRPRSRRGALVALGMATHALADFYAHTNWVELLGPDAPAAPLLGDEWPAAALPPDLHSGYFSLRHGLAGCPRRDGAYAPPDGFRACHATLNKDAPDRGHGAERMVPGGPTYHEVAVRLATAATRELWEALRVRLDAAHGRGGALLIALSPAGCNADAVRYTIRATFAFARRASTAPHPRLGVSHVHVVSIQVGRPREVESHGKLVSTAIFKAPVAGRVMLRTLNLDGDQQADLTVHGGPEKAVYAYPVEHYDFWRGELPGMDLPHGVFGENLTIAGLSEDAVHIGDRFRIGAAELTVTQPRVPCYKLGIRFGRDDMLKRFLASERTGWYFSVRREGEIGPGDAIERLSQDEHGVTVRDIVGLYARDKRNRDLLRRAIDTPALAGDWRDYFAERLAALGA